MQKYFSAAKIILMGEYAVLRGAPALCLPLQTGQDVLIENKPENPAEIHWKWHFGNQIIAHFVLKSTSLETLTLYKGDASWAIQLIKLIRQEKPNFLLEGGIHLHFKNYFPVNWGLGTSSATLSSLCRFAQVNPYPINAQLMAGSGADIACTTQKQWFLFTRDDVQPNIDLINQPYAFPHHTCFIYSGKKQATAGHLRSLEKKITTTQNIVSQTQQLIQEFLQTTDLAEAIQIIFRHESIISQHIGQQPLGNNFPDFEGQIKSLGAWGGDFFLAISPRANQYIKEYFGSKNYNTIIEWPDLLKTKEFTVPKTE